MTPKVLPDGFKQIPGTYDYYVNNEGLIYNLKYESYRKTTLYKAGYVGTSLRINGKLQTAYVHRLVALCFLPNPYNHKQINHIDGNKANNHYTNLEWCSSRQNIQHSIETGLKPVKNIMTGRLRELNIGESISVYGNRRTNGLDSVLHRLYKEGLRFVTKKNKAENYVLVTRI